MHPKVTKTPNLWTRAKLRIVCQFYDSVEISTGWCSFFIVPFLIVPTGLKANDIMTVTNGIFLWITYWSRIAAHLILVLVLGFLVLPFVEETSSKKAEDSVLSNLITMKFGMTILQDFKWISINWQSRISDMTSYFQDGGHNIISWKASSPSHVMSLACCMQYSISVWTVYSD